MPKVMLVEDDNNLREIYQARLQAEGYEIVSAKDGEEGLVIAKAEKPDLIIADVMMPKISGFEMLDILRNTEGLKDVNVIMLTALGQNEDEQKAQSLGANRYLVKSQVTLEDIVKAAQELLSDQDAKPAAPPVTGGAADAPAADSQQIASIPVAEPPADSAAPADGLAQDTATSAQSAAQEQADAESRIENFVAGATQEATPPGAAAPGAGGAADDTAAADNAAASDDKLVADAAQTLINSTQAGQSASTDDPNEGNNQEAPGTMTHKKVINPLDDGNGTGAAPDKPVSPGNIAL